MDITTYQFYKDLINLSCIDEIWLFGSRARKDHRERADIDLAIDCSKATLQDWISILDVIDDADTLLKIDCIRLDELNNDSNLKNAILNQGVKLYERIQN